MRKSGSLISGCICIALILLVNATYGQSHPEIKKIKFTGNKRLSSSLLRQALEVSRSSGIARLAVGSETRTYDDEQVTADLKALARFYQREGFLSVSIGKPKVEYSDGKRKVTLVYPVVEGPPVVVDSVHLRWMTPIDSTQGFINSLVADYQGKAVLEIGSRFRDSSVILDERTLVEILADHGYPFAHALAVLNVKPDRSGVTVVWEVTPGVKAFFAAVHVRGQEATDSESIVRQVAFADGELYRSSLLRKTQKRVYTLGMFSVVTVRPILDMPADSLIDVEIFVREAPRLTARVGVGYGDEEKFRVFSDTKYLRFLGDSRQLSLSAKHSAIEPYNLRLTLTQPAFPDRLSRLSLSPFIRKQDEPGFRATRYGGDVTIGRPIGDYISGSATYTFESVNLDVSSLADVVQSDLPKDFYQKSTIVLSGTYDDSQPLFSPEKGSFIASALTVSGLGFGSAYHFYRVIVDLRRYQPVLGSVLAARVKIGGIQTTGTDRFVPVEERLYAGGGSSVRGWARHELGPKSDGTPIGGYSSLESSLELRIPIIGTLSGVPFIDFGNVWITPFRYDVADLRYAAGLGLRYGTPIGPVRIDVARPVFDEDKAIQVHLSIGQAF